MGGLNARSSSMVRPRNPPDSYEVDEKQLSQSDSLLYFMVFRSKHTRYVLNFIDPEEVARQLTLIEHEWFTKITPTELLGQAWTKSDKHTKAPNVLGMIQRFNSVLLLFYLANNFVGQHVGHGNTCSNRQP